MSILPQSFYLRDTKRVARDLLGKTLCVRVSGARGKSSKILRARIVETEAYLGEIDRAAHTFGGRRTKRVESMYLAGGHAYVYFIYGMYFCLNVVTRAAGKPEAVLIRAVEPLESPTKKAPRAKLQTNGPGKLCRFYGITKAEDGLRLFSKRSRLWIEEGDGCKHRHISAKRIGIDYAKEARDWHLRFYLDGNSHVSRV